MKLFVLVARLLPGGLFFGRGAQKLFGSAVTASAAPAASSSRSACAPCASTPAAALARTRVAHCHTVRPLAHQVVVAVA
jgi:uncharacterized membrane protein YphA (DoxX/SURF4 family)